MIRLCFLIRQLNDGGAQRQLLELVKGLDRSRYDITIMTFYDGGRFADEVRQFRHVSYQSLKKGKRQDLLGFSYRLLRALRRLRPDVLHGYLGTANLLCILLKPVLRGTHMVWGVRASYMDLNRYDWLARLNYRLECLLSRFADLIIINSHAGRDYHLRHGFPGDKVLVIPNGIDTERFRPDPEGRRRVRAEWGVGEGEKLIGLVGRLDPMKDHPTFLKAAALLARQCRDVRFVCVGDGQPRYRQELEALSEALGLGRRIIWAGARGDMPAVTNALDIASSSSYGEGFPNAVGEAMACGVPCVVTDVGDSAWIVGDTGIVVPPKDPEALADGWRVMITRLGDQDFALREKVRTRICSEFDRVKLVLRTSQALEGLL